VNSTTSSQKFCNAFEIGTFNYSIQVNLPSPKNSYSFSDKLDILETVAYSNKAFVTCYNSNTEFFPMCLKKILEKSEACFHSQKNCYGLYKRLCSTKI